MSANEGRTTNQSTKFQNSKTIWLTLLTSSFIKPCCQLLQLFNKNLEKFTISGLSKISALSELRKFQKSSELRKFLNYFGLSKFHITKLREFSTQAKGLRKFQEKSRLKEFSEVMGLRMILSCIKILQNYLGSTFSENWSQDKRAANNTEQYISVLWVGEKLRKIQHYRVQNFNISQNLGKFHHKSRLRKSLNYWTQKFQHCRTQKFLHTGKNLKKLRNFSSSQNLESFHDNSLSRYK